MVARIFALGAALAAVAQAHPAHGNGTVTGGTAYTTEVVTAITTYCPEATTLTYNSKTYTVTEATTLTITDCPCTLTKPVKPTTTSEEAHTAYTTEVVTAITTYCPAATTLTHGDKTYTVTAPTTLTITDCPCTLTKPVKPTTTPVQPKDECAEHCYMAYNACRVKPDANMSSCAAEYASCVGYNPFGEDGSLVTPTACAAKTPKPTGHEVYTTEVLTAITTYCPAPTTMTFNSKTYTVTEPTTLTITDCPCTVSKPVPSGGSHSEPAQPGSSKPAVPAKDCPAECAKSFDECRYQPDANMSTCSAEYASCLGYNPFAADGSLVTPTACSVEQTGVATMPPAGPATGSATGPAAGPETTPSGPAEVPTGDAGRAVPGLVAVLGALALL